MRVSDVITYLSAVVPYSYYAYGFPPSAPNNCALVDISSGMPTDELGVMKPSIQLLVRGDDLEAVEDTALKLLDVFKYKRDFMLGSANVAEIYSTQSAPVYIGLDEANNHEFTINFNTTIRP